MEEAAEEQVGGSGRVDVLLLGAVSIH